jgi:hypothetical protein
LSHTPRPFFLSVLGLRISYCPPLATWSFFSVPVYKRSRNEPVGKVFSPSLLNEAGVAGVVRPHATGSCLPASALTSGMEKDLEAFPGNFLLVAVVPL